MVTTRITRQRPPGARDLLAVRGEVNVLDYARLVNGTDWGPAFTAALATGKPVIVPARQYRVDTTIQIDRRDACLVGAVGNRYDGTTLYGAQLLYYGTGSCIQLGTDNGHAWDAADYDGPQGFRCENIAIKSNVGATALDNGLGNYKAGGYGIRDWRGGQMVLRNVLLENFEYNFWGIQSDINQFHNVTSLYSKYGLYFGPRSDQISVYDLYAFFCDTAIIADQCDQLRIINPQLVGNGTATQYPVEIRGGSVGVTLDNPWFEHLQGYDGEVIAFVGAGLTTGYDGATTTADAVVIKDPLIGCNIQANQRHVKYLVAGDDCVVSVEQAHGNVNNLSRIFGSQNATAGSYYIKQVGGNAVNSASLYAKNGAATPSVYAELFTLGGYTLITPTGRALNQYDPGNANSPESTYRITSENLRRFVVSYPNSAVMAGNTSLIDFNRRVVYGTAAPTVTGPWAVGDRVVNQAPAVGQPKSWVCTVAGTPGTWVSEGNL